ncbi:MAG: LysR family transcriptional regulator [Rhodobacteraceae bacterium]|nr:LysR family transcriptional regulator [Paracoccaceae bacterium]
MSQINLHHLKLFHAIAHEGTLTGAARRLNLSASALSAQLRVLEARLGHDLFDRRGRALVLTEAGRIALDHADAIFRTAGDLVATLRHAGAGRRAFRVGALATLSRNFQLGFLRPVLGRKDVEVILRSGGQEELLRGLEALALDVVLSNLAPARDAASRYVVHRLDAQPVSLIGVPGRAAGAEDLSAQLMSAPLVLPAPETALRGGFDALVTRLRISPAIVAEVDDMAMIRLLAREDAGLAVIPPIVVRDELAAGSLVEVARLPGITEDFLAITLRRRFPNPILAELIGMGRR